MRAKHAQAIHGGKTEDDLWLAAAPANARITTTPEAQVHLEIRASIASL